MAQEKKKVLVVSQHFWPESFRINDVCDFMIDNGYVIEVLCGLPNYPKGKLFEGYSLLYNKKQIHNGVEIHRAFEIPRGNNSSIRIFLNYISFPIASLFHLPRLLFKKYDKILLYQTSPVLMTVAGILLGKIKRVETTMYVLDLWPENLYSVMPIKNRFLRFMAEGVSHWHYRHVDKLIVLSQTMQTRILHTTKKPEANVIILPQACEKIYETDVHDAKLIRRLPKGFNVLFTGSITPAQSFSTMIQAAAILKKQGLNDINWIIVGDGMAREQVEQEVAAAKLDNFYFEGQKPLEDMPRYIGAADLLVGCLVKSDLLEATIPAKVMSYIASGKPLVLAMDGEVRSLINTQIHCGYAGPTEDAKALARNILKIYELPEAKRTAMGNRGRAYHFKHFERNLVLTKMLNFMSR